MHSFAFFMHPEKRVFRASKALSIRLPIPCTMVFGWLLFEKLLGILAFAVPLFRGLKSYWKER
jgi:hypothetical protein